MENNKFSVEEYDLGYEIIKRYVGNRREVVFEKFFKLFAKHISKEIASDRCKFLGTMSNEETATAHLTQIFIDSCTELYDEFANDIETAFEDYNEKIE